MEQLEFEKVGNKWEKKLESDGERTIQVNRAEKGGFTIYATLEASSSTSEPTWVSVYDEPTIGGRQNIVATLDMPEGVGIKIVSWAEVLSAYIL